MNLMNGLNLKKCVGYNNNTLEILKPIPKIESVFLFIKVNGLFS
jgi:hypothetical protein